MPDDITIRRATVDEAPIVAHHRRAMFFDMGYTDLAALNAMDASFLPYVSQSLADEAYRGWLARTSDGCVVAGGGLIVHAWPSCPAVPAQPRRAYILNVYTEPDYRGRGIARRIMTEIVEWCRTQGFSSISLHASAFGRPLYESLGFEPTNEMRLKL